MAARRRRKPRWDRILPTVAALHLGLGLAFSELTAVRSVRVLSDGRGFDEPGLARRLDALRGRPWLASPPSLAESLAMRDPWVMSAAWRSNPMGRAVLELRLREPVAVRRGREELLSADGVWLPGTADGLPEVALPEAGDAGSAGFGSPTEGPRAAELLQKAREAFSSPPDLELDGVGVLSLRFETGQRVVLGSWERTGEKLAAAARILGSTDGPGGRRTLNVTVPERPVWAIEER